MMPGKSGSPACSLRTRLSRISCLTDRERSRACRSSPNVWIVAAIRRFYNVRMHTFFTSSRPLVFAHRGGGALAPENTMAAFANAVALGADGVELDVRLSRDGVAVVIHDDTLDRTTTLDGPVAARTVCELAVAGVPSLVDVLSRYPTVRVIVELKVDST